MNRTLLRLLTLTMLPVLSGCNPASVFSLLEKRQEIMLLNVPLRVTDQPRQFVFNDSKLTVMGDNVSVCVVLAVDVEMGEPAQKALTAKLNGARLKAALKMVDGSEHVLEGQGSGWRLMGAGGKRNEIFACARASCAARPPVGAKVARMWLSATAPVNALGVYWESSEKGAEYRGASPFAEHAGKSDKSPLRDGGDSKRARC